MDNVGVMASPVKARQYTSALRQERAQLTRRAVLDAARRSFADHGYVATTVARIAAGAGVHVDTVYAAVGTKPAVFRLLLETAISGGTDAVDPVDREYVAQIREAGTARAKLEIYATAVTAINERLAPLHSVMAVAAGHAPELAAMRDEIARRRADNMRLFASDLAATGELAPGTDLDAVADVVWATSGTDFFAMLVTQRGWTTDRYRAWLGDAWRRLFLTG